MKAMFKNLFGGKGTKANARRGVKLGMEALEDRALMTVALLEAPTAALPQGRLWIIGNPDAQNIDVVDRVGVGGSQLEVRENGSPLNIVLPDGSTTTRIESFSFRGYKLEADLAGGNDTFIYRLDGGYNTFSNDGRVREIDVDLGGGESNVALVSFLDPGTGAVKNVTQNYEIAVTGREGRDFAIARVGSVLYGHVYLSASLGANNDTFDASLTGDLTSATVSFSADGGAGMDQIKVAGGNFSRTSGVDASSALYITLNGGLDADTTDVNLVLGPMNGRLSLVATGGEGYGPKLFDRSQLVIGTRPTFPLQPIWDSTRVQVVTTPESTGEVTAILYEGSAEENDYQELYLYAPGARRGYAYSVNGGGGSGDTCQATWNVDVTGCESVTRRS